MASSAKKRTKGSKASNAKRKRRHSGSEEDEPSFLSSKYAEPPTSKIYNSRFSHKDPAELFRKDLISAMKLPDSEPLSPSDFWLIDDPWRTEWEKGVQVPVYPESLPEPHVRSLRKKSKDSHFKLPKKLIRFTRDSFFNPEFHVMSYTNTLAERTCRYDMDDIDVQWLKLVNEEREDFGLQPLEETFVEQVLEEFEVQSFVNFQESIKSEEGLGNQYDEDAVCDVCRSPDYQEDNEMVFCDSCNICVHQICYGITKIPEGSWICRTCALGITPACVLCPNRGGAMKTTRCGQKWAHVGCAVWIPEVSFFNFVKMEPITKISQIPPSRWALVCFICNEKKGVCIQCSEKNCKTSFHVTCAFKEGLQMRATVKHTVSDDDVLLAFCKKHSQERQTRAIEGTSTEEGSEDKRDSLTSEERANLRQQKIEEKGAEFYNYVNLDDVAELFQHDKTDIEILYSYWKLKRRSVWNRALLPPKIDVDNACVEEDSTLAFLKKLVHHRQDLERVRNLCYMVTKREKLVKRWIHLKQLIFLKQNETLKKQGKQLSAEEREAVIKANYGDLAYDKKYTGVNKPSPNTASVLTTLVGKDAVQSQVNGMLKNNRKTDRPKSEKTPNPYAKHYLNGLLKRSQRWLAASVDKQCKITKFRHSFDSSLNHNLSFQSSPDHAVSDDGCESSKDMHDMHMGRKSLPLKFGSSFNASDDCTTETYHDKETAAATGHSSGDLRFHETLFCQSSNDSPFTSPSKTLSSHEESASDTDSVFHSKTVKKDLISSGLEKCDQNPAKIRQKQRTYKKEHQKVNKNIKTIFESSVQLQKAKEPSEFSEYVDSPFNQNAEIKYNLDIPIENCIEVQSEENGTNNEIIITPKSNNEIISSATESSFTDLKVQLEKCIDIETDEKLNSPVHCVIVKSDIPLPPNNIENVTLKLSPSGNSVRCLNNNDPVVESNKNLCNKSASSAASTKDVRNRPLSHKSSLQNHSKVLENGLKPAKQNKHALEKLHLSKQPKSKSVINSASSPVHKTPSSPLSKCQDKSVSKNDHPVESYDSSKDTPRESPSYKGPIPRKDMLRGYKIPKKIRTEKLEEKNTMTKEHSTPASPLPSTTTATTNSTPSQPTTDKTQPLPTATVKTYQTPTASAMSKTHSTSSAASNTYPTSTTTSKTYPTPTTTSKTYPTPTTASKTYPTPTTASKTFPSSTTKKDYPAAVPVNKSFLSAPPPNLTFPNATSPVLVESGFAKGQGSWRKMEPRAASATAKPRTNMNGSIPHLAPKPPVRHNHPPQLHPERSRSLHHPESERLVLKLKKDFTDPEAHRWKTDANHYNHRNNNMNMGEWVGEGGFVPMHPRPRRMHPPHLPPFIQHHPRRPWPRGMRGRGGFRPIHMGYGGGPYT